MEGVGLTRFKIISEYIIMSLLVGAGMHLWTRRGQVDGTVFRLLIASLGISVASEMSFTLYTDPYGFANMLGHLLKICSFYLIYRAIVVVGLSRPYGLLFREIQDSRLALRKGEERLRLAMDSTEMGAFEVEICTGSMVLSKHARQHLGIAAHGDLDFEKFKMGIHPDERERLRMEMAKALQAGDGGGYEAEFRSNAGGDDRGRWIAISGKAHCGSEGRPDRFIGVTRDVTEQRTYRETLRMSEERYRTLFSSMSEGSRSIG